MPRRPKVVLFTLEERRKSGEALLSPSSLSMQDELHGCTYMACGNCLRRCCSISQETLTEPENVAMRSIF